jgi:hypothetical protein
MDAAAGTGAMGLRERDGGAAALFGAIAARSATSAAGVGGVCSVSVVVAACSSLAVCAAPTAARSKSACPRCASARANSGKGDRRLGPCAQRVHDRAQALRRAAGRLQLRHDQRPEPFVRRFAFGDAQRQQRVRFERIAEPDRGRLRGVGRRRMDRKRTQGGDAPLERERQRLRRDVGAEAPQRQAAEQKHAGARIRQTGRAQSVLDQPHATPGERVVRRPQMQPLDLARCGGGGHRVHLLRAPWRVPAAVSRAAARG